MTTSGRAILHVDMDAFFAAIEQRDRPELRGKPVLIGGSPQGRGVVSTASYEARPFGCHSAQPMREAVRRCPAAIIVRPRMQHYAAVGRAVREIFQRFTPLVEPLSIDEAFLDVTGSERLFGGAEAIARRIKQAVAEELRLTCSIGVAPIKFVAKLASDLEKPDGLVVVAQERVQAFLDVLPVARLWGAGKATQRKFADLGVKTFADVRRLSREVLVGHFGESAGAKYYALVRGEDPRAVTPDRAAKSISHEQTFAQDIAAGETLRQILLEQMEDVASRLRGAELLAQTVFIKVRTPRFATYSRRQTLSAPTDRTDLLWDAAQALFDAWYEKNGGALRLLGAGVSDFHPRGGLQRSLFAERDDERQRKLDRTVDEIRNRFGADALTRGGFRGRRRRR